MGISYFEKKDKKVILKLFALHKMKMITFLPHTTNFLQVLDLQTFGNIKKRMIFIEGDFDDNLIADHITKVLKAIFNSCTPVNVRKAFNKACFFNVFKDGLFRVHFDEEKMRNSTGFQRIWNIDYDIQSLSKRRRNSVFGFLNRNDLDEVKDLMLQFSYIESKRIRLV
jgi:hypothetical protein